MKRINALFSVLLILNLLILPSPVTAQEQAADETADSSLSDGNVSEEAAPLPATALYLNCYQLSLTVNETARISVWSEPDDAVYSGGFYSDNSSVAIVDETGTVTAIQNGYANIYYQTDSGMTAGCSVTVSPTKIPLVLNSSRVALLYDRKRRTGSSFQLKCKNQSCFFGITYQSDNPQIAEVSAQGLITARKAGNTVIRVTADGVTKKCRVSVAGITDRRKSLNEKSNRTSMTKETCERIVYGKSVLGRDLEAYVIRGNESKKKKVIFLDFACHGFEDSYAKDGKVLVQIGNELIRYYAAHPEKLADYTMVIVPCANPDGTIDGKNNLRACGKAFGRCTAAHVDMNRDFGAFRAKESRALKKLLSQYSPKVYLNFHGWLDETLGTPWLSKRSAKTLHLKTVKNNVYGKGYIATYVKRVHHSSVCLVEYKSPGAAKKSINKTKRLLNRIMKG